VITFEEGLFKICAIENETKKNPTIKIRTKLNVSKRANNEVPITPPPI
jgi:hypothetical protein